MTKIRIAIDDKNDMTFPHPPVETPVRHSIIRQSSIDCFLTKIASGRHPHQLEIHNDPYCLA
jgi:hypothetical protein